ncbi:MAG: hypothetical protein ACM3UU_08810 [Ignavibacteriales bacterium]
MKWFESFIDSCRDSLELSSNNLKLYVPNLISFGITLILVVILFIMAVVFGVSTAISYNSASFSFEETIKRLMPLMIAFLVIGGIILPIIYCMVEAGVLMMSRRISEKGSTSSSDFFDGLKKYWVQVLIGVSIIGLLVIIIFIPLVIVFILADILTFGYGVIAGWAVFNVLFGTWGAIMVVDEISAWEAIKKGYGFGKKNFWGLFFIFFSATPIIGITSLIISTIPLLGILASPLIGIVIGTYFKLVLVKYYYEVTKGKEVLTEPANNY